MTQHHYSYHHNSVCTEKTALVRNQKYYEEIQEFTSLSNLVKVLRRTKILHSGTSPLPIFLGGHQRLSCLLSQKKFLKNFQSNICDAQLSETKFFKQFTKIEVLDYEVKSKPSGFCVLYNLRHCKSLAISSIDRQGEFTHLSDLVRAKLKSDLSLRRLYRLLPKAQNLRFLTFFTNTLNVKVNFYILPIIFRNLHLLSKSLSIEIFLGLENGNSVQGLNNQGQNINFITQSELRPQICLHPASPEHIKVRYMFEINPTFVFNMIYSKVKKLNLNLRGEINFEKYIYLPESLEDLTLKIDYNVTQHTQVGNGRKPLDLAKIDFTSLSHLIKLDYEIEKIPNLDSAVVFFKPLNNLKSLESLKLVFDFEDRASLYVGHLIDNLANLDKKKLASFTLLSDMTLEGMTKRHFEFFEKIKYLELLGNISLSSKLEDIFDPMKGLSTLHLKCLVLTPFEIEPFFNILSENGKPERFKLLLEFSSSVKIDDLMAIFYGYLQKTKAKHLHFAIKGINGELQKEDTSKIKACLDKKNAY